MAESSTAFGTDFGQKVDLTASIRNILRNYPEGTAILKELLQNAGRELSYACISLNTAVIFQPVRAVRWIPLSKAIVWYYDKMFKPIDHMIAIHAWSSYWCWIIDDAGAKSIKFCLDCRSHGTSSVAGPNLRDYQVSHTTNHLPKMQCVKYVWHRDLRY